MTFNIKLGLQLGVAPLVELVREIRPDLLALQEVGSSWRRGPPGHTTARLALQTGLDHALFVPTLQERATHRYGHALLSRWPLRSVRRHRLPARLDEPRVAVAADIVTPDSDLRFVATHLSHLEEDRAVQGPDFGAFLDEAAPEHVEQTPLVVAGDLNEPRDAPDPWMRRLLAQFDEAGRIDPSPTFENPVPDRRIDYLLVDGTRWSDARVPDRPDLSDHLPVVAEY